MLRRVAAIVAGCLLLAGCSDDYRDFSIDDFRADVVVSRDGSAFVEERLTLMVSEPSNYGGLHFDISLAFLDLEGRSRSRSFDLIDAFHYNGSGYHNVRRIWQGRTVYIGDRHCRRCSPDLHVGKNRFRLGYKLGRLFEDHDGRQILTLPSSFSSVNGMQAAKTLTFHFPPGGKVLAPENMAPPYTLTLDPDGKMTIALPTEMAGKRLPDIQLEYPAGTFATEVTRSERVNWWLEDHLKTVLAILGLVLSVLLSVAISSQLKRRAPPRPVIADLDVVERVSPGLAAMVSDGKKPGWVGQGCRAAAYWVAIAGYAQLSEQGPHEGTVISNGRKPSRKEAKKIFPSTKVILHALRRKPKNPERLRLGGSSFELVRMFSTQVDKEYQKLGSWAFLSAWPLGATMAALVLTSIVAAYWSGFLFVILIQIIFFLVVSSVVAASINKMERSEIFRLNGGAFDALAILVALPVAVLAATYYLVSNFPGDGQEIPWMFACLNIVVVSVWLCLLKLPSARQKNVAREISLLREALFSDHDTAAPLVPTMSVELFERYLPMAIALDAEQQWRKAFEAWHGTSGLNDYWPRWTEDLPPGTS